MRYAFTCFSWFYYRCFARFPFFKYTVEYFFDFPKLDFSGNRYNCALGLHPRGVEFLQIRHGDRFHGFHSSAWIVAIRGREVMTGKFHHDLLTWFFFQCLNVL
ncbi:MAG: hypothetical protein DWI01_05930 [Planctomycetota bacterium]|nr:MAG: hypothetical protein DWI01_05930 [Planctomycetota bacterium]